MLGLRSIRNVIKFTGRTAASYISLAAFLIVAVVPPSAMAVTITDLGTLGGLVSFANAINASGQVTGDSTTLGDEKHFHAFLYSNGKMTDLGFDGQGNALNNLGQVAGTNGQALLYSGGSVIGLGVVGVVSSSAFGINNSGQIVGVVDQGSQTGSQHAFLYSAGQVTDLGGQIAEGINDNGQIALTALSGNNAHAFLYSSGTTTDLGTYRRPNQRRDGDQRCWTGRGPSTNPQRRGTCVSVLRRADD